MAKSIRIFSIASWGNGLSWHCLAGRLALSFCTGSNWSWGQGSARWSRLRAALRWGSNGGEMPWFTYSHALRPISYSIGVLIFPSISWFCCRSIETLFLGTYCWSAQLWPTQLLHFRFWESGWAFSSPLPFPVRRGHWDTSWPPATDGRGWFIHLINHTSAMITISPDTWASRNIAFRVRRAKQYTGGSASCHQDWWRRLPCG